MTAAELLKAIDTCIANHRLDQARRLATRVLELDPTATLMLLKLSYIELLDDHFRLAREYTLRAYDAHPGDAVTCIALVQLLRVFNLCTHIHAVVANLPPALGSDLELLHEIGTQLANQGEPARSLEYVDRGLALAPGEVSLLVARSQMLMFLGRFAEAEADVVRSLRASPDMIPAWWGLSRLRRQTPDRNHVEALQRLLTRPSKDPKDRTYLAYALHKELDDLGEFEAAGKALDLACANQRRRLPYSRQDTRALFRELKRLPSVVPVSASSIDPAPRVPIFIVGMHRSGTTLLEQLLDGHPEVAALGELCDFADALRNASDHLCRDVLDITVVQRAQQFDYGNLGDRYLGSVEWRRKGKRYFTDKMPSNFLNIGFMARALPQARILHMVRDPIETCFSNLRELFSDDNNRYSYDQEDLADYYHQYEDLMAHWHSQFPGRILDVDYAGLTGDTASTLQKVCDFCGLSFVPEMLDTRSRTRGITTASTIQVRDAVTVRDVPKWTPYADYLQPMISALARRPSL